MKLSRSEIINHYQKQKKLTTTVYDDDCLLCTITTGKGKTKAVFVTDDVNSSEFRTFIRKRNELKADSIVVYCEFCTVIAQGLEIILNRDWQ